MSSQTTKTETAIKVGIDLSIDQIDKEDDLVSINMIADLSDPDDEDGRSYRKVNNSRKHKYKIRELVEIKESGVRLFVAKHTRDCDGAPLYSLTPYSGITGIPNQQVCGYSEASLKGISS